ncbi:microviridin/marinostatin family tricyclic proteinase inhibitor [Archangium sp.]|jgi:hypothetical protein|uniref:microviridin/marinostatin family tricyclic proteinase inhibitor n=1 Tax=Archangium sp. TaxID=1872627 RepID=UPI003899B807
MKKDTKKPFFARLLEEQELEQVSGGANVTQKFPSDGDESLSITKPPVDSTQKYPSDTDESGGL